MRHLYLGAIVGPHARATRRVHTGIQAPIRTQPHEHTATTVLKHPPADRRGYMVQRYIPQDFPNLASRQRPYMASQS